MSGAGCCLDLLPVGQPWGKSRPLRQEGVCTALGSLCPQTPPLLGKGFPVLAPCSPVVSHWEGLSSSYSQALQGHWCAGGCSQLWSPSIFAHFDCSSLTILVALCWIGSSYGCLSCISLFLNCTKCIKYSLIHLFIYCVSAVEGKNDLFY